jgi:hypothetical protein
MEKSTMEALKQILEEVQARLEPHRNAKASAQDLAAHALVLKQQSAANVVEGEKDADQAHQLRADHNRLMEAKKAERVKARADRIASGRTTEAPPPVTDDAEGRRLNENAEEADAALARLREIDSIHGIELQKAEAAVVAAASAIYQAYLEGIAGHMIEHDSIMRGLHAELSAMVPSEINRPRTMRRPSPLVEKALALVVVDQLHVPSNQLRGGATAIEPWIDRKRALTG